MIFLKRKNNLFLKFNEAIVYDFQDNMFYLVNNKFFIGLTEVPLYEVIFSEQNKQTLEKSLSSLFVFSMFLFSSKINFLTKEREEEIRQITINFLQNLLNKK